MKGYWNTGICVREAEGETSSGLAKFPKSAWLMIFIEYSKWLKIFCV
jgi:hypothetical protein